MCNLFAISMQGVAAHVFGEINAIDAVDRDFFQFVGPHAWLEYAEMLFRNWAVMLNPDQLVNTAPALAVVTFIIADFFLQHVGSIVAIRTYRHGVDGLFAFFKLCGNLIRVHWHAFNAFVGWHIAFFISILPAKVIASAQFASHWAVFKPLRFMNAKRFGNFVNLVFLAVKKFC